MKGRILMTMAAMVLMLPGLPASQETRFTVNGDGTVTDNVTGLMWQQQDDNSERNWENALAYCQDLGLAGYTDWRVPNVKELRSIVDNARYNPAIDTAVFPGTIAASYWSSSTYAYYTGFAWRVYFDYGSVSGYSKAYTLYVRCAR